MLERFSALVWFNFQRAALVIAVLGAVLFALYAIIQFVAGSWFLGVVGLISVLIYVFIFAAQRTRNASLYLPFLALTVSVSAAGA